METEKLIEITKKLQELQDKCDVLFAVTMILLAIILMFAGLKAIHYELDKENERKY